MARLTKEEIVALKVLLEKGQSNVQIANQLGVTEGTVRYHRNKAQNPKPDGRSNKPQKAEAVEHIITYWMEHKKDNKRPPNIKELYEFLTREHSYQGSYNSIRRFVRKEYPAPKQRTYRRVETPPGAQVQTDWAEFPKALLCDGTEGLHAFIMILSHSRQTAVVWSQRQDQLSWLRCHNEAFRRLGGIAAVNRIDNLKTGISKGASSWGQINQTYRTYAREVGFHVDACRPRSPNEKGKVEAKVRLQRLLLDPTKEICGDLQELQGKSDKKLAQWGLKAICPATGKSVNESWQAELECLAELPVLPEPFDVVVTRLVSKDCLVNFEGRQYCVPFAFSGQQVEVRGCSGKVQIVANAKVIREYQRGTKEKLLIDPSCYEGSSTDRVIPPPPLGKMGAKLQEIMELPVENRPLDLYAALAEVARR